MDHRGHAAHFLTRIDRLGDEHAELALGLYRDEGLVEYVLSVAKLPGGAKRVALALDEGKDGPHIIVTREGKFVTCLGRGMRVQRGDPVVSRRQLDHLSQQIEALRDLMANAKAGTGREADRLVRRVLHAGAGLTQEEFDDLVVWSPLAGRFYLRAALRSFDKAQRYYDALSIAKRIGRKQERVLRGYYDAIWAAAHLTTLLGAEPQGLEAALDGCDAELGFDRYRRTLFITNPLKTWVLPVAFRAMWLAAKLPKTFVPALEEELLDDPHPNDAFGLGFALAGATFRRRGYRAGVQKCLDRFEQQGLLREYGAWLHKTLTEFQQNVHAKLDEEEEHDFSAVFVGELIKAHLEDAGVSGRLRSLLEEMPPEAKRAGVLGMPFSIWDPEHGLTEMMLLHPAAVRMEARDFYVPAAYRSAFVPRFNLEYGLTYVTPRLTQEAGLKPKPRVNETKQGRNEPCSCGSGKKYKRCCGAS